MVKMFLIDCKRLPYVLSALALLLFFSCAKEKKNKGMSFTPYTLQVPARFPAVEVPENNAMSVERVALGRKLYYDPILSNDGKSCSSCHLQSLGFTSDNFPVTPVLPHVNLAWSKNFLWKGGYVGLENIARYEVNEFFRTDIAKVNADAVYRQLFYKAYGVETITADYIAYALAQFLRTQISGNSKFDRYRRGEAVLTPQERDGMITFFTEKGDCFHCHNEIFFTDNEFHNNGLDSAFTLGSKGLYDITGQTSDIGKYKTPTLRNCALRDRFMHDGRFTTLEEVIEFYDSGVKTASPNIDPLMTLAHKESGQLHLTQSDKANLLSFLQTLTDTSFLNNPELARPQ